MRPVAGWQYAGGGDMVENWKARVGSEGPLALLQRATTPVTGTTGITVYRTMATVQWR